MKKLRLHQRHKVTGSKIFGRSLWGFVFVSCCIGATGLGCAPLERQGNAVQQAAPTLLEFSWLDYRLQALPDQTAVATVADWSQANTKLKFFVNKHDVYAAKIQAQHPTRDFRNANGGFVTLDAQNNVVTDPKTGKPADGNIPSKQGEIQGVVIIGADGLARGLPLTCFQTTFANTKDDERCKNAAGERYLKLVGKKGDDYSFETTKGTLIATAKKSFVSTNVLATYQDATYRAEVSVVELGPGVEVWAGKFIGGMNYDANPHCKGLDTASEGSVFTASPPPGYTGNEFHVDDALSKASCALSAKPITWKVRCLSYHKSQVVDDGEGGTARLPGKFCTKAEIYEFASESSVVSQNGGFGIWLVVKDASQAAVQQSGNSSQLDTASGTTPSTASTGTEARLSAVNEGICAKTYTANERLLNTSEKQLCTKRPYSEVRLNDAYVGEKGLTKTWSSEKREACFNLYCAAAK